jgi:hypothetical protein
LGDEVVHHLGVRDPVDWEEEENFAGYQGGLQFVDETVVPRDCALLILARWPRFVDVKPVARSKPESTEATSDDTSLRWLYNVPILSPD